MEQQFFKKRGRNCTNIASVSDFDPVVNLIQVIQTGWVSLVEVVFVPFSRPLNFSPADYPLLPAGADEGDHPSPTALAA